MNHEIHSSAVVHSLDAAKRVNDGLQGHERQILDSIGQVLMTQDTPLMLSHAGLVLTPRLWTPEVARTLGFMANTAREGLGKIAYFLATSESDIARGIRENMLGGPHFARFEQGLLVEAAGGISEAPFEVGRADLINGGAVEVNAACLDAPIDFHDLTRFHQQLGKRLSALGLPVETSGEYEDSIVELIVDTMVTQAIAAGFGNGKKPILAWIGTAKEIYGDRGRGGYWSREMRFAQVARKHLKEIGFDADFQVIAVEQLDDPDLVKRIGSGYRNLLPEDMNTQTDKAIEGLITLSTSGRLVGSLTAELLTNKAAMAVLCTPELAQEAGISAKEWEKYAAVFPPTAFLSSEHIWVHGEPVSLQALLEERLGDLFFKLSNGEEGHGVFPGDSITPEKLKALLELAQRDPYAVIVQVKLDHFPFEVLAANMERYSLERLEGQTDAGAHYQMLGGELGGRRSNIVMTRFMPGKQSGATNGNGIFRPVVTKIQ